MDNIMQIDRAELVQLLIDALEDALFAGDQAKATRVLDIARKCGVLEEVEMVEVGALDPDEIEF